MSRSTSTIWATLRLEARHPRRPSKDRGIYGEATPAEVKGLVEDGVKVAPLPPAARRRARSTEQGAASGPSSPVSRI